MPIVKKVKILFLRRWYIMGSAALLAAAAIFYAANYPAFVTTKNLLHLLRRRVG